MTICYLVIIVCLNPYAPLLILAGCCWFVNLLIDGSAICNASSLLMLSEHAARSFSAASHLSLWVTSFYGLQTRPIFYINFKIFIPSSDKSTFMSHVSVLFCSEPTTIMTLAMVYVSSGGFFCVRAPNWPTWSTGQAGIRLGLEKVKSSLRKFQKHRDCCVSWQKGGCKERQKIKLRVDLWGFFYQETDWLGLIYVCSKACSLLPCKRPAEERMTRQTAGTQSNKGKSLTASPED